MFDHLFTVRGMLIAFALMLPAVPLAAQARVSLSEEQHINYSLISAAIGALIVENCQSMVPRKVTAAFKAWQLNRYALDLGYSDQEIDTFLNSKTEQDRVRAAAESYLLDAGATTGDEASYCAVGRAEIDKDSLTGQLLRVR